MWLHNEFCFLQIAEKNREILALKERIVALESEARELANAAKRSTAEVSTLEQVRETLEKKNMELELTLASIRANGGDAGAHDVSNQVEFEAGRGEVQRLMDDLNKRFHDNNLSQRDNYDDDVMRERKRVDDVMRKVCKILVFLWGTC